MAGEEVLMPDDVRILPHMTARVETGPTQFGNDWPGVFIRGDNAFNYHIHLRALLASADGNDIISTSVVAGLADLLGSCIVGPEDDGA
jgi:hypothetical protein